MMIMLVVMIIVYCEVVFDEIECVVVGKCFVLIFIFIVVFVCGYVFIEDFFGFGKMLIV